MIKHTPQEIADFFSCYVAMDSNWDWYGYTARPMLVECEWLCVDGARIKISGAAIKWDGDDYRHSLHEPHIKCTQDKSAVKYEIFYITEVQERLNEGWELVGSPFIDEENKLHQAMIKRERI